ncbi:PH domain-containing protein [Pseudonocardia phyllosphaerae]|uniref:PH domain-containing protein n=1 Tax=Pseudonocardia phyllosphaerae TaxID=3390502 RepID=UPI00397B4EB7
MSDPHPTGPTTPGDATPAAGPPAAEHGTGGSGPGPGADEGWRRLPVQMLLVSPVTALLRLVPALAVVVIFGVGRGHLVQVWIALGAVVLALGSGAVRWRTTRYRVTPDRVELHSGLLNRQRRSVPRDRIRTVDLTAPLLHRLVGVSVVKVGTGQSAGKESRLDLDAVTTGEAEHLRRELLATGPAERPASGTAPGSATEPPPARVLDRLDWSSLRYAPLTISSLAAVGALFGAGWNMLRDADIDPTALPVAGQVAGRLSTAPLWAAVLILVAVLLVLMVAGSLVLFVERWWGFLLTREADGTLRVKRGLLTRRSLSVSEDRLRGVRVTEPLLVRALGRGAQAGALTVGLGREDGEAKGGGDSGALGPPVRRGHAHLVAARAAQRDTGPAAPAPATAALDTAAPAAAASDAPVPPVTDVPLVPHPKAARTRRLVRAVVPSLVLPAAALVLLAAGGPVWPLPVACVAVLCAVPLGLDRYRALGHRLDDVHLVARRGSLARTTTALRREGVIGWRLRQSLFQQRVGVVTLEATTAARGGALVVCDVSPADAVALMTAVTPAAAGGFATGAAGARGTAPRSAPPARPEQAAGDLAGDRVGELPPGR